MTKINNAFHMTTGACRWLTVVVLVALAAINAKGELSPQYDLQGMFGPAGARMWDEYTRQAYLAKPDADWDGLNDEEERACIALWGGVEENALAWHDGVGDGTFTDLSSSGFMTGVSLPFVFNWGGEMSTNVLVCRNGVLSFDGSFPEGMAPAPLPVGPPYGKFLSPYWHVSFSYSAPDCRYWAFTPADYKSLVVCWENLELPGLPDSRISFQVEMRSSGEMILRYRDLDFGGGPPPETVVGAQKWGAGWSVPGSLLHQSLALRVMPVQNLDETNPDTDGDGIIDGIEFYYYDPGRGFGRELNPSVADNPGDIDRDGLDVTEEFLHGQLDPFYWDTDDDMLGDGYEVSQRLLAYDDSGIHGLQGDADGDGLSNRMELRYRTHTRRSDTDRDGIDDQTEITNHSNPTGPGRVANPSLLVPVRLTLGDPGLDGMTEAYAMKIDPISGDHRSFTFQNTTYDGIQTADLELLVGGHYRITLDHLGSRRSRNLWADPDYEAKVEGVDGTVLAITDKGGLLGRHLSNSTVQPGTAPVNTNLFAEVWVISDGVSQVDPLYKTRLDAWPAGRSTTAGPILQTENASPGVLVLHPGVLGTITPAKLRLNGIAADSTGLTRWLRFSDPTRISYKLPGESSFIRTQSSEVPIPGSASVSLEVELQASGTWSAGTSVDVSCIIKTTTGQIVSESDHVRLLGLAVAAIGDSLTYGFRRTYTGQYQMPLWQSPWFNYPTVSDWSRYYVSPTDINFQGSRGYLRRDLTSFIPWLGHDTNGNGPEHCGYPGSRTYEINRMLVDTSRALPRGAVQTGPGVLVVVYFIGMNDVVGGRAAGSVYSDWKTGLNSILTQRAGRGRTLVIGVTLPKMRGDYQGYTIERQNELVAFNSLVRAHQVSTPFTRYVVADAESIPHDLDDDGLHFMARGYGLIEEKIRDAVIRGLRAQP